MESDIVREATQDLCNEIRATNQAFVDKDAAENTTHYYLSKAYADELRQYVESISFKETWIDGMVKVEIEAKGVKF